MSQPILSLTADEKAPKAVANILPCRIHHNGPITPVADYWNPTSADDGSKIAYFRGRKLQGKSIKLPEQCRGVVVERKTDEIPPVETVDRIEDGEEVPERIGSMQVTAEFDELVVWGHEDLADATSDPYIRSMEEWLQVADQIHSYAEEDNAKQN
ncbi:ribonuclease H2 non-catalytic subunit-domain-containing protein [Thelonectria olida]|uniref:Ribonuclease H2 non-catalytic subunit-domain-containing protein n=1 Tax=Thelonectria olida TaxID=1576542 RepID=A0A9P8W679_9HYPO|nr:ribonuclease H2 non-catalytic subunit-domain-containing protein [Thelonectria olida]